MYKNILIPIALDHGRDSSQALKIARRLKSENGQLTLLTVVEEIPPYVAHYMPEGQMEKNCLDVKASLRAEIGDVPDAKTVVITGHAGTTITEYAVAHDVDLIVVASHRPGLQDYFLGSTAARVVRHAPCAVHVVR